jgi:hypothetical protein
MLHTTVALDANDQVWIRPERFVQGKARRERGAVRLPIGIEGRVARPPREHPKRPVEGFACRRREVSGSRLWGWARERFGTPGAFFRCFFVVNWCPLLFLEESGRNLAVDRLPASDRAPLEAACDELLTPPYAGKVKAALFRQEK